MCGGGGELFYEAYTPYTARERDEDEAFLFNFFARRFFKFIYTNKRELSIYPCIYINLTTDIREDSPRERESFLI